MILRCIRREFAAEGSQCCRFRPRANTASIYPVIYRNTFTRLVLLACLFAGARAHADSTASALISRELDTQRSLDLHGTLPQAIETIGNVSGVPIEVDPMAVSLLARVLAAHNARDYQVRLDTGKAGAVITESRNVIIDASFDEIPFGLHAELKAVPGVLETGLFEGFAFEAL